MRALVFLVAASCCSAQLVLPYAPWVLPQAKLITTPEVDTKAVTPYLASPFLHPLASPYLHTLASPYLHAGFPYTYTLDSGLKTTEFPYIYTAAEDAAEEAPEDAPAVEEARRKRRSVAVPLPYLHAVPSVTKTTVETKQFEPVDAATPADTTKIELTTKEHEISVPSVKYVQPVIKYKPVTYTAVHPTVPFGLPYAHPFGLHYGFPYGAAVVKVDEE